MGIQHNFVVVYMKQMVAKYYRTEEWYHEWHQFSIAETEWIMEYV